MHQAQQNVVAEHKSSLSLKDYEGDRVLDAMLHGHVALLATPLKQEDALLLPVIRSESMHQKMMKATLKFFLQAAGSSNAYILAGINITEPVKSHLKKLEWPESVVTDASAENAMALCDTETIIQSAGLRVTDYTKRFMQMHLNDWVQFGWLSCFQFNNNADEICYRVSQRVLNWMCSTQKQLWMIYHRSSHYVAAKLFIQPDQPDQPVCLRVFDAKSTQHCLSTAMSRSDKEVFQQISASAVNGMSILRIEDWSRKCRQGYTCMDWSVVFLRQTNLSKDDWFAQLAMDPVQQRCDLLAQFNSDQFQHALSEYRFKSFLSAERAKCLHTLFLNTAQIYQKASDSSKFKDSCKALNNTSSHSQKALTESDYWWQAGFEALFVEAGFSVAQPHEAHAHHLAMAEQKTAQSDTWCDSMHRIAETMAKLETADGDAEFMHKVRVVFFCLKGWQHQLNPEQLSPMAWQAIQYADCIVTVKGGAEDGLVQLAKGYTNNDATALEEARKLGGFLNPVANTDTHHPHAPEVCKPNMFEADLLLGMGCALVLLLMAFIIVPFSKIGLLIWGVLAISMLSMLLFFDAQRTHVPTNTAVDSISSTGFYSCCLFNRSKTVGATSTPEQKKLRAEMTH